MIVIKYPINQLNQQMRAIFSINKCRECNTITEYETGVLICFYYVLT